MALAVNRSWLMLTGCGRPGYLFWSPINSLCRSRPNAHSASTEKMPELWHPDTGVIEPAPVWREDGDRTTVGLNLDAAGSVFVIFRQPATHADHIVDVSTMPPASSESAAGSAIPELKIEHAVYKATDGTGEMDVTAKLSARVQDGQPGDNRE